MRRLLVLCLALVCTSGFAETYRWVDATGRVIISDSPPPGKPKNVLKADTSEAGDGLPFAVKRAAEAFPVTLFTSADCVADCKNARELLNGRGVPFTEKMVQTAEEFAELKALVGDAFVPALKVGNQRVRGFEAASYNNLLDLAGYPAKALPGSKPSGGLSK